MLLIPLCESVSSASVVSPPTYRRVRSWQLNPPQYLAAGAGPAGLGFDSCGLARFRRSSARDIPRSSMVTCLISGADRMGRVCAGRLSGRTHFAESPNPTATWARGRQLSVKIKHIAAVALTPAAIAGVGLSVGAWSQPAPSHQLGSARSAHALARARQAGHVMPERGKPARGKTAHGRTVQAKPGNAKPGHAKPARTTRAHQRPQASAAGQQARQHAAAAMSLAAVTVHGTPFEKCVAWRESSDTPTDPDGLFGILPATWASLGYTGTAGRAPIAVQVAAFNRLYAAYGTQPWAPSDGC